MKDPEVAYYNALALRHHGSYHALKKLFEQHASWRAAYEATHDKKTPNPEQAFAELDKRGVRILLRDDADFPALLREIPWPPFALYVRGTLPKQNTPTVAIVGTRKATPAGLQFAHTIAGDLARHGVIVVSGLALGMDAAAHAGVVEAHGIGIAVLASGLEKITPRTNERLGEELLNHSGAIISEYPLGTESIPRLFLERNRIVSGLSQAVVVVEAPKRSGTLATARFAIEQNRDLLVVPGGVTNANYEGSNDLIKQGAQLITESADILKAIGLEKSVASVQATLPFLDETQQKIVLCLTELGESVHTDALSAAVQLPIDTINEALALLSVMGVVKEDGGRYHL